MKYVVGTINREGDFKVQLQPLDKNYEYDGEPLEEVEFAAIGVLSVGKHGRLIFTPSKKTDNTGGKPA